MKRSQSLSVLTLASLLILTLEVSGASIQTAVQHRFRIKEYELFYDVLELLQHEALPQGNFSRIRSMANELVARGEAILKLGVPEAPKAHRRDFAKTLRKFEKALAKFNRDANTRNTARLKESFADVHDSFETLADLVPKVYPSGMPPPVRIDCPIDSPKAGSQVTLTAQTPVPEELMFTWAMSEGKIISGQGTPTINIDTRELAGQTISIRVEVNDGFGLTAIANCEIQISANSSSQAQSVEFNEPWKNPQIALALDPYEGNEIDWEQLATDTRVIAIIHRATIGDRADRKYAERRDEAKKRGYKWGAYHLGKPGDPRKQADFFLETVKPAADDLIALDLESTDDTKDMSFAEARVFIKRIKKKTGRYPLVYANNRVTKAISDQYGPDDVFSKTRLWYARFKKNVTDFPLGTWKTYTVWQFSSELNCSRADRAACLYTVPGTEYDMDVDVYNGTIEELKNKWPFAE